METERIRVDQTVIDKYSPDRFALQLLLKEAKAQYEYLVNGQWQEGPPRSKPEGKRVVFSGDFVFRSIDSFRIVRNTYLSWKSIADASVYEPVGKNAIIERLIEPQAFPFLSRAFGRIDLGGAKRSATLFVPWGVRPQGQFGEPEEAVLNRIRGLRRELKQRGIQASVLIMPADVYATEVNRQVSRRQTNEYFARVASAALVRDFEVKPWSELREKWSGERYRQLARELTDDAIRQELPLAVLEEARGAARRRSGYVFDANVEAATFRYLQERLIEATIIEETYRPIKVSTVAKNKDNYVDRNLPRVYIIPSELQFPWLK